MDFIGYVGKHGMLSMLGSDSMQQMSLLTTVLSQTQTERGQAQDAIVSLRHSNCVPAALFAEKTEGAKRSCSAAISYSLSTSPSTSPALWSPSPALWSPSPASVLAPTTAEPTTRMVWPAAEGASGGNTGSVQFGPQLQSHPGKQIYPLLQPHLTSVAGDGVGASVADGVHRVFAVPPPPQS